MSTDKPLLTLLEESRAKDQTYKIKAKLIDLYAPQSSQKEIELPERFTIEYDRKEIFKQGVSELTRTRNKKTRKSETKKVPLCYFPSTKKGKIFVDWGTYSGVLRTQIRRVVREQKMLSYRRQPWWELMTVSPSTIEFVPDDKMIIKERIEPRGMHRGNIAYEVIPEADVEFEVEFNSSALPTDQEVIDLFHAIEGSPFGPTKNGKFKLLSLEKVQ